MGDHRFLQLKGQERYLQVMVISLGSEIQVAPYLGWSPSPAFKSPSCVVMMVCLHGLQLGTGKLYMQ